MNKNLFYALLTALILAMLFWLYKEYQTNTESMDELKEQNEKLKIEVEINQAKIDSINLVTKTQEKIISDKSKSYDSLKLIKNQMQSEIKNTTIKSESLSEAAKLLRKNLQNEKLK